MGTYVVEECEPSDYYVPLIFSDSPPGGPITYLPTELYLRWRRAMNALEEIEEEIAEATRPLTRSAGCACDHGCASRADHKGQFPCWYRLPKVERW
jgi:hypothetical protein